MQSKKPISDLLAHRDGDVLDASAAQAIDDDASARADVQMLRRIKRDLQQLPDPEVGDAELMRMFNDVHASVGAPRRPQVRYPFATAAAVFLATALSVIVWNADPLGGSAPASTGGYLDLVERSQSLESVAFEEIPLQRADSRYVADSPTPRDALMLRIADLDSQLNRARDAEPQNEALQQALWQQRVNTLECLVELRRPAPEERPALY